MRVTRLRPNSLGKMRRKIDGGASNKANFGRFDAYMDGYSHEYASASNMEWKWKFMGWATIGSFFMIHKMYVLLL